MPTGDPVAFCPVLHPWWGVLPPPCTCGQHYPAQQFRPMVADRVNVGAEPAIDIHDTGKRNREMAKQLRALADQLDPPETT